MLKAYNQIINTLMSNDENGSWDEILTECKENYTGTEVLKYAVTELIESLETSITEAEEKESKEFYQLQYSKALKLV